MPTGSFQQYTIGFTLMVTAILAGIILSWIGGQLIDGFYGTAMMPQSAIDYASHGFGGVGTNPVYEAMSGLPVTVYFVNLFYFLCFALPVIGVMLFWQGFVKYQSAEGYAGQFDSSGGSGGRRMRRRRVR